MFFFPLTFTFLPASINSKMLVAILGAVLFVYDLIKRRKQLVCSQYVIWLFVLASLFSVICYASVTYNGTNDMDYTTYVVSMIVWLSAGYASYRMIKEAHGFESVELITQYVIKLCLIQCLLSMVFILVPEVQSFFETFFVIADDPNSWERRLHGLGVSFDTAGIRNAIALVLLSYLICKPNLNNPQLFRYSLYFIIIFFLGNMMARTTSVGAILGILYIVYKSKFWTFRIGGSSLKAIGYMLITLIVISPILYYAYNSYSIIRELFEFGFEFLYNYIDAGEIHTHSSQILREMWTIWPDNLKTWLIGDGLFRNPDDQRLFYMGTDVGYARFIFYCGIIGLSVFIAFFVTLTLYLERKHPNNKPLFYLLLILGLSVWTKVSTDIFFVYAFLLCVNTPEEDDTSQVTLNSY